MRNIVSPLDGIRSPFGRRLGAAPFTPASLFAASEPGVWYDPSDLTTLFQDAAGTTPVTAMEQPVGLILDKSKGLVLGSELVTNGDFSNGTTGWTGFVSGIAGATLSNVSNTLRVTKTGSTAGWAYSTLSGLTSGRRYQVSVSCLSGNSGVAITSVANSVASGDMTYDAGYGNIRTVSFSFVATATTLYINVGTINASADFDNISVRELPGNHAFQSTAASRPVLSARYNLLTYTEQFDNAAWTKARGTITATTETSPINTATADVLTQTAGQTAAALLYISNTVPSAPASTAFVLSIYAKKNNKDFLTIGTDATGAAGSNFYSYFNISNGTLGTAASGHSLTITDVGSGWYRCTLTATTRASVQNLTYYIGHADTNGSLTVTDSGSTLIWGADLRVSNDGVGIPSYQRVGTATDYDTTGFPYYLRFDGTDDSMATASIDFSGTDKMSVFAGVRKLSDAGAGVVASLGTYVSGNTFELQAPHDGAAATYQWAIHGNGTNVGDADFNAFRFSATAPTTNVVFGSADRGIANTSGITARNNGAAVDRVATTLTGANISGNFANAALSIGQRATPTNRFNGRLYSLIVRGAASSDAQIASTETWVNGKTGAWVPSSYVTWDATADTYTKGEYV